MDFWYNYLERRSVDVIAITFAGDTIKPNCRASQFLVSPAQGYSERHRHEKRVFYMLGAALGSWGVCVCVNHV